MMMMMMMMIMIMAISEKLQYESVYSKKKHKDWDTINQQWHLGITKDQATDRFVGYITRFRFIEILFHIFYYNLGKESD